MAGNYHQDNKMDLILKFQWCMTCSLLGLYVLITLLVITLGLYYYGNSTFTHFSRQDVPHYRSLPFLGNMGLFRMKNRPYPDFVLEVYNNIKEKPYGCLFSFQEPVLVIKDPALIESITTKYFHYFSDRRPVFIENRGPLWKTGLPHLQGLQWIQVRTAMNKCFDLNKMNKIFSVILECCQQFSQSFENHQEIYEEDLNVMTDGNMMYVELKGLFTRFTNDFIATTVFGVKVDSLKNPRNEFYIMGQELINFEHLSSYRWLGYTTAPKFMKDFGISLIPGKVTDYFKSLLQQTMSSRAYSGISKSDLLQLLIETKKENKSTDNQMKISEEDITANALIFYLAGFDTVSTLLCLVSYELAKHPDVQSRLIEEIDNTLEENGGKLTYDTVKILKYLDMVVSETLRMHPPVASTDRTCVRHYSLYGDPEIELKPRDNVLIPIYGLHHDPKYFPNPESFDPERFSEENKHKIHPYTYMPFGAGPRSCLGVHFALLGVKLMLVHLLSKYNLYVIFKTPNPLKIVQTGFNITAKGGFWLGLQKRNTRT